MIGKLGWHDWMWKGLRDSEIENSVYEMSA